MNEESRQMSQALVAIHDEALRLLQYDGLPDEIESGLELIVSIARHGFDVRTNQEIDDGSETD